MHDIWYMHCKIGTDWMICHLIKIHSVEVKFVFEVIYMKTQEQHTGASFIWQKSLKTVVVEASIIYVNYIGCISGGGGNYGDGEQLQWPLPTIKDGAHKYIAS